MKDWTGNGRSAHAILGARNYAQNERETHDYYATEPKAATLLLDVETFAPFIWECACGEGHLVGELEKAGYMVYASDLIDRGCGEKLDFLASVAPPHSGHGHRYEPTVFPCERVCGTRARHLRRWLQGRNVSQNTVSGGQVPAGAV